MNINLYKFAKRENSTKQPTGTGTQFTCMLKEPTSAVEPTVILETSGNAFPDYNYAYIAAFGRYYFITDIVSDGHMWIISMTTDILATYKSAISAASLYLLRCSSVWDGDIIDNYYPISTDYTTVINTAVSPWIHDQTNNIDVSSGTFIVGIAADPTVSTSQYGSITYYAMSQGSFVQMVTKLLDDSLLSDFSTSDASLELQKAMVDPLSFIKSAIWIPDLYSSLSGFSAQSTTLKVWTWVLSGVNNKTMTTNHPYRLYNAQLTISAHPMAATRGDYLNVEPFTKLILRMPPFGIFDIDTTLVKESATLRCQVTLDYITGTGILEVFTADGVLILRHTAQVGVSIQLSQVSHDYVNGALGTAGGAVGTIANILTGNIGGAITNGISAIGSAANAMRPIVSDIGSNGAFSGMYGLPTLYHVFYSPVPDDLADVGRPLCQFKTISTLSSGSFFMARSGDVAISGTAGEQAQLKEFLETGIFYE